MATSDWYRRTTWTEQDAADFQVRLKRSRSGRGQHLRIQAGHLSVSGLYAPSLELLMQALSEQPGATELPILQLQRAKVLAALGRNEEAFEAFRDAIGAEAAQGYASTNATIDFALSIVQCSSTGMYDEALLLVAKYESQTRIWFPIGRYHCAAVRACIAHARNDLVAARRYVDLAAKEAAELHSGLPRHPKIGLVANNADPSIEKRLAEIRSAM